MLKIWWYVSSKSFISPSSVQVSILKRLSKTQGHHSPAFVQHLALALDFPLSYPVVHAKSSSTSPDAQETLAIMSIHVTSFLWHPLRPFAFYEEMSPRILHESKHVGHNWQVCLCCDSHSVPGRMSTMLTFSDPFSP